MAFSISDFGTDEIVVPNQAATITVSGTITTTVGYVKLENVSGTIIAAQTITGWDDTANTIDILVQQRNLRYGDADSLCGLPSPITPHRPWPVLRLTQNPGLATKTWSPRHRGGYHKRLTWRSSAGRVPSSLAGYQFSRRGDCGRRCRDRYPGSILCKNLGPCYTGVVILRTSGLQRARLRPKHDWPNSRVSIYLPRFI